jgi:hypothetical protein
MKKNQNIPAATRRNFLHRLFTGSLLALPFLASKRAAGASLSRDTTLTGTTNVPNGATLNIAEGATLNIAEGAVITGLEVSNADGDGIIATRGPTHAIFQIPLGINGSQWCDFELKGSRNNFNGLAAEALCYFYGSQYGDAQSSHGRIGITEAVYFTDDLGGTDHAAARKWRKQDTSRSLYEQRQASNSVIGGVIVMVPLAGNAWLNPNDTNLRFVYQRVSPSTMEEVWVPILPQWKTPFDTSITPTGGVDEDAETPAPDPNPPGSGTPVTDLVIAVVAATAQSFYVSLALQTLASEGLPNAAFYLFRWKTPGAEPNPAAGDLYASAKWEYCGQFLPAHWVSYLDRRFPAYRWTILHTALNGHLTGRIFAGAGNPQYYAISYATTGGQPLNVRHSALIPTGALPENGLLFSSTKGYVHEYFHNVGTRYLPF